MSVLIIAKGTTGWRGLRFAGCYYIAAMTQHTHTHTQKKKINNVELIAILISVNETIILQHMHVSNMKLHILNTILYVKSILIKLQDLIS